MAPADTGMVSADTATPSQVPSPSQRELRKRVRAVLFDGAKPEEDEYASGTVLGGRFRIVGLVGRGGMGEVYRARDLVLDEEVAMKFLPQSLAHDERFMTRFVGEVRIARQVTHPNVCRVHDIGEIDGRTYLSMEFIDGEDLASLLRRIGRLPLEKASELAQQLCRGLSALHERDVLHRDLKPHNLMVDGRGELKITDFGLAAAAGDVGAHELRDGTPAYMAPEQAEGREVTIRSDLYALGLILSEVLTGKRVRGDSDTSGSGQPKTDTSISAVPGIPREVDEVIRACLQTDPALRPPSALVVAAALPGGDPVAAALALGQTPSIDALLRSGGRGRIPGKLGHPFTMLVALALLVLAVTFPQGTVLGDSETLPPDVLRHQARELLETVAWSEGHFFEHSELRYDDELVESRREELTGQPVVLMDYRRQGPPMVPRRSVSMLDPPYDVPGASRLTLDGHGRLRSFFTVLPAGMEAGETEPDFAPLFAAADLDPQALEAVTPKRAPVAFVDRRVAWRGHSDALDAEVEVEASARGSHIVAFDVIPQWDERYDVATAVIEPAPLQLDAIIIVPSALLVILGLAVLARRVVKRGEADTSGAARVSLALGIGGIVIALLDPDLLGGGHGVFPQTLAAVLGGTLTTYWAYVAVEPFSRRFAPGAMTSWVKLVRGRFADPVVARDVLVGAGMAVIASGLERLGPILDGVSALWPNSLSSVDSVAGTLSGVSGSMAAAPLVFLAFVGLVRLVRNRKVASGVLIAGVAGVFAAAAMGAGIGPYTVWAKVAAGTMWGVSIARFGLLGLAAFQLTRNVLAMLAITIDGGAWYASTGYAGLVLIVGLVAYGWWYGVARRPATAESG